MIKICPNSALKSLLKGIKNTKILVIGDIMLDRFIYGQVDRISPESPVPVLAIKREDKMLGGAGNTLANLAGLECDAHILSVVGNDDEAAHIAEIIETLGFKANGLIKHPHRPTIVKTRFLAGHQQLLRTDFERAEAIDDAIAAQIITEATKALKDVDALILSDYGKGMLRPDVIAAIIKAANKDNIPVIIDPKGQDFSIYSGATAITPNKKELNEATKGAPVDTDADIICASQTLIDECNVSAIIATRSGEGISVIEKDAEPTHIRSGKIEVFDVSGAGDTVIATIAATIAAGGELHQAATLANLAGSIVVTKVGTASIHNAELVSALEDEASNSDTHEAAEICEWNKAAETIKRWKASGLKTGFTNGCFDILHFGHISYLQDAAKHCDRLIIGLNSDASVRTLKGKTRPIHDESSRAAVLAALACVDMVVLFGGSEGEKDQTAIELLNILKPDIYFKGGDYTESQIPETPTVKANGGEVKVMPVYKGHSTTNSIEKMNDEAA